MNFSGFSGYGISNIYPQWGSGETQTAETNPEPEEQQSYSTMDNPNSNMVPVDKKSKLNMGVVLIAAILLVVVFGVGRS